MDKEKEHNEDVKIIKEIFRGNESSFAQLINRYKNMIYNLAFRMTGNKAEAEDIIQESLIKAYRNLRKYDLLKDFPNWLYTITLNVCKSRYRRKKFAIFSLDNEINPGSDENSRIRFVDTIPDNSEDPEEELEKLEEQKGIQKIINCLPHKYKEVFVLRYIENKTYKEITELTGLPLGTVKTYIFRGQKILCGKIVEKSRK